MFKDSIDPLRQASGWKSPEFHIMGQALSCLHLNS